MNRRAFLQTLAAAVAGATLDPERLLWRPGAKSIFLPPPPSLLAPTELLRGDLFTIEGVYAINPMTYAPIERLQQFVITADITAGTPVDRCMSPHIVADGPYRNVNRAPFHDAKVQPFLMGRTMQLDAEWSDSDVVNSGQKMRSAHRVEQLNTLNNGQG